MTLLKRFWEWLVWSSHDPKKVALTVKAGLNAIAGFALLASPAFGWNIGEGDVSEITEGVYQIVLMFYAAFSAILTAWGLFRKIVNTIIDMK